MPLRPSLPAHRSAPTHRQHGLTLLEALVALLLLAFGVLGILSVQWNVLAATQGSAQRSHALRLIDDLAERLKSNPDGFVQLQAQRYTPAGSADWDAVPSAAVACDSGARCTSAQLADWDLAEWHRQVPLALPGAKAATFFAPHENGRSSDRRQLGVMIGWPQRSRARHAQDALYRPASDTDTAPLACPDGLSCHLAYLQP